jgi:hypothetical protein
MTTLRTYSIGNSCMSEHRECLPNGGVSSRPAPGTVRTLAGNIYLEEPKLGVLRLLR